MGTKRTAKKPAAPKRARAARKSSTKPLEHSVGMMMAMRRSGLEPDDAVLDADRIDDPRLKALRDKLKHDADIYRSLLDDNQNVAQQHNVIVGIGAGTNAALLKYTVFADWVPQIKVIMGVKQGLLAAGVIVQKQTQAYKSMKEGLDAAEKNYVGTATKYEKELKELDRSDERVSKEIDRVEHEKKELQQEKKESDDLITRGLKWLADLFKQKEEGKVSAQAFSAKEKEIKAQTVSAQSTSERAGAKIQALSTQHTTLSAQRNQVRQRAQQITSQRLTTIPEYQAMASRVRADLTTMAQRENQLWNEIASMHQQLFGNQPMPLRRAPIPPPAVLKSQADQIASRVYNDIAAGLARVPRKR